MEFLDIAINRRAMYREFRHTKHSDPLYRLVSPDAGTAPPEPIGGLSGLVPVPLAKILIPAENGSWLKDADYLLVPMNRRISAASVF